MELAVERRDTKTKAQVLRKKGLLPAILYGRAEKPTPITVDRKTFEKVFKVAGESTVLTLKGLDEEKQALIHDVAFDAVTDIPLHADFYAIQKGQKVQVAVPLEFTGVSPAVKDKGGILVKVMHELRIEVEPKDLPQALRVDISTLVELEDQIKVKDLALPPGATVEVDMDEVVAMISVAKEEPVEEVSPDISQIEVSVEKGKKDEEVGGEAQKASDTKAESTLGKQAPKEKGKEK